jgi:hypothetical protein
VAPQEPVPKAESKLTSGFHIASHRLFLEPDSSKLRTWTDRSGTFKVDAVFLGVFGEKCHLHKSNGVKIAVPMAKLSAVDMEFVSSTTGEKYAVSSAPSSPTRETALLFATPNQSKVSTEASTVYNGFDWLAFFQTCGIVKSEAQTYAEKFAQERMDQDTLSYISREILKDLGVREGDIIRVMAKSKGNVSTKPSDTTLFTSPNISTTSLGAQSNISVSGILSDPKAKAKILEAEKEAQKRNLDTLLARQPVTTLSAPPSIDVDRQLQIQKDEELARKFHDEEMKRAGLPTTSSSRKQSTSPTQPAWQESFSTAVRKPETSKSFASGRSSRTQTAVDVDTIFSAAKAFEKAQAAPTTTNSRPPSMASSDAFAKPATSNSFSASRPVEQKPSTLLPEPLLPVPSQIIPMNVNVSDGSTYNSMQTSGYPTMATTGSRTSMAMPSGSFNRTSTSDLSAPNGAMANQYVGFPASNSSTQLSAMSGNFTTHKNASAPNMGIPTSTSSTQLAAMSGMDRFENNTTAQPPSFGFPSSSSTGHNQMAFSTPPLSSQSQFSTAYPSATPSSVYSSTNPTPVGIMSSSMVPSASSQYNSNVRPTTTLSSSSAASPAWSQATPQNPFPNAIRQSASSTTPSPSVNGQSNYGAPSGFNNAQPVPQSMAFGGSMQPGMSRSSSQPGMMMNNQQQQQPFGGMPMQPPIQFGQMGFPPQPQMMTMPMQPMPNMTMAPMNFPAIPGMAQDRYAALNQTAGQQPPNVFPPTAAQQQPPYSTQPLLNLAQQQQQQQQQQRWM